MELRHLKYFVTIAEEGTVSRAAERLNISQPAVSRQLRDLEEELGAPLFIRNSQGLTLTESGETALLHAKDLLRRANALVNAVKPREEQSRKVLKVGYIPTALTGFLADGMRKFNETNENTCVQIREMNPAQQETALRAGELDLALLGSACPELQKDYRISPILRVPLTRISHGDLHKNGEIGGRSRMVRGANQNQPTISPCNRLLKANLNFKGIMADV